VLVLLAVLRPRLGSAGWCRVLQMPAADLAGLAAGGQVTSSGNLLGPCDLAAEDLLVLARMAHVKYRRLGLAVDLTGAGIILLAAGLITGALT
jgi:hypothetical protein